MKGTKRDPSGIDNRNFFDLAIRVAILGLLFYWALLIIWPLLGLILWTVILTVVAYPIFSGVATRFGGRQLPAAAIVVLLGMIIVFGPLAAVLYNLADTLQWLWVAMSDGSFKIPAPADTVSQWPIIGDYVYRTWSIASTDMGKVLSHYSEYLLVGGNIVVSTFGQVAYELIRLLITILSLRIFIDHWHADGAGSHQPAGSSGTRPR